MRHLLILISLLFCSIRTVICNDALDPQLLDRLKTEGFSELRAQEKAYQNIHIKWIRIHDGNGYENDYFSQNENVLLKSKVAQEYRKPDKSYSLYRFVKNHRYFFNISKMQTDEEWNITDVRRSVDFAPYAAFNAEDIYEILPVYLFTNSISDLLKTPGFDITAVSVLEDQLEETVSVDFEITANGVGEDIDELRTGNILFLPTRGWVTKEITANFNRLGKEFTTKFEYTYGENQNKNYSLERINIKLIRDCDDPSKDVVWDNEIRQVDNATVPEEEFYMSFYGLPEPEFDLDKITLFQYLFMFSGSLLIVIALWQILQKLRSKKEFTE